MKLHALMCGGLAVGVLLIASPAVGATVYVSADVLNCRALPSTSSMVVTKVRRGASLQVLDRQAGWARVRPASATCWVTDRYVGSEYVGAEPYSTRGISSTRAKKPKASVSRARSYSSSSKPRRSRSSSSSRPKYYGHGCPCSGSRVCIGPRGGRYCITSGGNKRYGV